MKWNARRRGVRSLFGSQITGFKLTYKGNAMRSPARSPADRGWFKLTYEGNAMHTIRAWSLVLLLMSTLSVPLQAQAVIHHSRPSESLSTRWDWAVREAQQRGMENGYWIGYSIRRPVGDESHIVIFSGEDRVILRELIRGDASALDGAVRALSDETALLFRLAPDGEAVMDVDVRNLSWPVNLGGRPLFWLGRAEDAASIALLERRYARADAAVKEDLVGAVGQHERARLGISLLEQALAGARAADVREEAASALGHVGSPPALQLLVRTIRTDSSEEVREEAVAAIGQIERPAATDALIQLARTAERSGLREEAVDALAEKATERAVAALEGIVYGDATAEIQQEAVEALARLPGEQGLSRLIEIARTHENPAVREEAIEALAQTGDPRAIDVLVDIIRGQ